MEIGSCCFFHFVGFHIVLVMGLRRCLLGEYMNIKRGPLKLARRSGVKVYIQISPSRAVWMGRRWKTGSPHARPQAASSRQGCVSGCVSPPPPPSRCSGTGNTCPRVFLSGFQLILLFPWLPQREAGLLHVKGLELASLLPCTEPLPTPTPC